MSTAPTLSPLYLQIRDSVMVRYSAAGLKRSAVRVGTALDTIESLELDHATMTETAAYADARHYLRLEAERIRGAQFARVLLCDWLLGIIGAGVDTRAGIDGVMTAAGVAGTDATAALCDMSKDPLHRVSSHTGRYVIDGRTSAILAAIG